MKLRIGVDVGGTFTDFLVVRPGADPQIHKVLSTPADPSIGLINGLEEIAQGMEVPLAELAGSVETIVHGTTVTTNAVLTLSGARTGLLTTNGVRDALEMRRGIREEQYNNRYTNVPPLVPRYLRRPVRGRLNYQGDELESLCPEDVERAIEHFEAEQVDAVAICFMNSFADPAHEQQVAQLVRKKLPGAYLTVSSDFLPSIRFYDRVSSTVLNSYVGPKLSSYLERLGKRLREIGFGGVLLIMQSNGGVMSPAVAHENSALTLLSGPAAGPQAGMRYVLGHGCDDCITMDMGGTSFDAALVRDGTPIVVTEGEINRYRIALPMLDIVTIGAGGGSIGWIDHLHGRGPGAGLPRCGVLCRGQDQARSRRRGAGDRGARGRAARPVGRGGGGGHVPGDQHQHGPGRAGDFHQTGDRSEGVPSRGGRGGGALARRHDLRGAGDPRVRRTPRIIDLLRGGHAHERLAA
jgi:N-methylhydantoinase A